MVNARNVVIAGAVGMLLGGCSRLVPERPEPEALFTRAASVAAEDPGTALDMLERAIEGGLDRPSRALWEPGLTSVRDAPDPRSRLREILREHARESSVRMTADSEPGEPMTLNVTLVDEYTRAPLRGARLYVVHTDVDGRYLTDSDEWNPRLFAFGTADADGRIEFRSIRPGYYPPEVGPEPAHVHYNAEHTGYRPFDSEIWFDDDWRATPAALAATGRYGARLAHVEGDSAGWVVEVTIAMQPSPPEVP